MLLQMKEYPKVPRHNFTTVPDDFFESGNVRMLEKLDGGNFRFTVYEERFENEYPDVLTDPNHSLNRFEEMPSDGDVVVGSKKLVIGTTNSVKNLRKDLRNPARRLKSVDVPEIRKVQDEYGPVTFFAENMIRHTLDYGYEENPPPPVLGFDICIHRKTDSLSRPNNPYEQVFDGFLEFEEMINTFESIGIPTTATVRDGLVSVEKLTVDPEKFEFPVSAYADVLVEGVVFRKPQQPYRVKLVRPEFKELNKKKWGLSEKQAENGNEIFVARYCTPARVNKIVDKMVVQEGYELEMGIIEELRHRVYDDIWEEEWRTIKEDCYEFNPAEVKPLIASICRGVVERRVSLEKLSM